MTDALDLPYFRAPREHALLYPGATPEKVVCGFCSRECIYHFEADVLEGGGQTGCLDCLMARRFMISNQTEIGVVSLGRLFGYDGDGNCPRVTPAPSGLRIEALTEICYSPGIATYQHGPGYLCHCGDFMTYIGRWRPEDFVAHSRTGDGRSMWQAMVDEDMDHLWDLTAPESEEYRAERARYPDDERAYWASGAACYVFQCRHCGAFRCHWDCG